MKKATIILLTVSIGISINVNALKRVKLKPAAFLNKEINESSALVKSKNQKDLYWSLNDSGGEPRIFPLRITIKDEEVTCQKAGKSILVKGAVNTDWESMSVLSDGKLIISDCGNNRNNRKDLAIYITKEPKPDSDETAVIINKYEVFYPDQKDFPPASMDFDCEAVFAFKDEIYFLSKNRKDAFTKLYKLENPDQTKKNKLKLLDKFEVGSPVTGAEANADNTKIAVLTYENIWIFESNTDDFFNGKKYYLPITAKQCEGICWDGEDILITNEQCEIFRAKTSDFQEIKP
ncbi:MAG: hypothetical protein CSB55_03595 [Candidatus Cloacimonadota bacterium]|nr:MAG: hypothetical protein CSB55_03595 [Candidatus Cloacimonadota bacterium]